MFFVSFNWIFVAVKGCIASSFFWPGLELQVSGSAKVPKYLIGAYRGKSYLRPATFADNRTQHQPELLDKVSSSRRHRDIPRLVHRTLSLSI